MRARAAHLASSDLPALVVVRRTLTYWNARVHKQLTRLEPALLDYAWVREDERELLEEQVRAVLLPPVTPVRTLHGEPLVAAADIVHQLLWLAGEGQWDEDTTIRPDAVRPGMCVEVQLGPHGVIQGVVLTCGRNVVRLMSASFSSPIRTSPSNVLRVVR